MMHNAIDEMVALAVAELMTDTTYARVAGSIRSLAQRWRKSVFGAPPPEDLGFIPFERGVIRDMDLPAVRVVQYHHVETLLRGVPADIDPGVTLWIDSSTMEIDVLCFRRRWVSRILVRTQPVVHAAVLGALIRKLDAYEPDLVDLIRWFAVDRGDRVFRVGNQSYEGCRLLTEVVLPRSITHIGLYAFYGCALLTTLTLPNSLTYISDSAFAFCESLTVVTLPAALTHIGDSAFSHCSGLTKVTMPNSVTHVGKSVFYLCTALEEVVLPDSLARIQRETFYGCSALTQVTLPTALTRIDDQAFYECTTLARVTMPAVRPSISRNAFWGCASMPSLALN